MKRSLWIFIFVVVMCSIHGQVPLGEWQDHASYVAVHKLYAAHDRVLAATRMAMFSVFTADPAEVKVEAMTKTQGLTDIGISTFAYDDRSQWLAIAYTNSAIDLKRGSETYHIADIRYSNISGDKKIYNIRFHGRKAYLATGFGIVVVDLVRHEIEETYYLGADGSQGIVYDIAFTDSLIVAATDNGLLSAPKASPRLHVFDVWQRDTLAPIEGKSVRMLEVCNGRLIAAACTNNPDSLTPYYQLANGGWGSWETSQIRSLRCHNGKILLNRADDLLIYDSDFQLQTVLNALSAWDVDIDAEGALWVGHAWAGVIRLDPPYTDARYYAPKGPSNDDYVYSFHTTWDRVYICKGGKKPTYESAYLGANVSYYDQKDWQQIDFSGFPIMDMLQVAVDPTDQRHVSAASWGYGIVDCYNGEARELFNHYSVPQLSAFHDGDWEHLRIGGLAYDWYGDLWATNSLVNKGLIVRHKNGDWESFDISPMLSGISGEKREIDKIIWDSIQGYKWFAGRANRIYIHDGKGQMAYVNPNNGSRLETHTVNCLVQDHSGDIWFGTDKGIKVIYDGYRAFANGGRGEQSPVSCNNILFSEDGIYEYLMAYENISCIAVDGANRKWVGTSNNGLYLISANGLEQLEHFTASNSSLNSDKITCLAIQPQTGELYIGTNMGVQSYRTTATYADNYPSEDIHAFPNPVRPNYDGPIAIKGFTRNALVHITDARGHVVYSTTADGGQAVWNGRTLDGQRVASGTYFVFASDQMGAMRSVAKILIIR